ncbi:MAG: transposase [Anaerolineae bacterium]
MPQRQVKFAPGEYYHIYNRGSGRNPIFREQVNYQFLLLRLKKYSVELSVAVIAYCLMPNHYHFLLRQDGLDAAGLVAQRVFNSYVKMFNKRYNRTGTLFEGRFKAIHVDREGYLLHLCRYIHANPVKDGLVARLEDWPYSNYHEWVGARNGSLVDREFVTASFPQPGLYRQFVQDYLDGRAQMPKGIKPYLLR